MSLLSVREKFAELSGRHDLVVDFAGADYSDSGADWHLNTGQRMLDRKASFLKVYSWCKKDIAIGDYSMTFRYAAAIKEVWIMGVTQEKVQLAKKSHNWMREEYGEAYADETSGTPAYYCPTIIGLSPDQSGLTAAGGASPYTDEFTYDSEELMFGDHWLYNGVLFLPPSEAVLTVSVLGRFKSKPLSADADKTFWTEVHPDILISAGMWSLERFYRNREGVLDHMLTINDALMDLDKDVVEQEAQDLDEMEG